MKHYPKTLDDTTTTRLAELGACVLEILRSFDRDASGGPPRQCDATLSQSVQAAARALGLEP